MGAIVFSLVNFSYPIAVFIRRRYGFRVITITSGLLVTLSYIVTPFMPSIDYLFLTYCVGLGFGVGFIDCTTVVILPEFFDKYIGLATGFRLAGVAATSMTFNFLVPILVDKMGWRNVLFCFSSVGLLLILYAFFYRKKPRINADNAVEASTEQENKVVIPVFEHTSYNTKLGFIRNRGFQLIVLGCIPYLFAVGVPTMFMVCISTLRG